MKNRFRVPAVLLLLPLLFGLRGFPGDAASQKEIERRYAAAIDPASIREFDRLLSAEPHHIGSARGEENARWMVARLREWGLDARLETFDVLFPTPRERLLELVAPTRFRASLAETPVEGDPTSAQTAGQLPTYNAYSIDGDVTAPLVYVNYGLPADYERLERMKIDVRGKIVLARYGASWRGIKPKVAAEHGAVGCLIYSDPRDDGYFEGDVYPLGAYRPEQGVQRGSVADMPLYPGDPLTPGVGATRDARRLDRKDARTLTKIPVLPISYGDARPLLAALGGRTAPREWRGGLPVSYHVGPGPATVHLKLAFDWKMVPAHDVIARIEGSVWPDEWVIHGNHHDAWVNGASDPVSGLAALLEEARSLGALVKTGWRPKRTIILCAWDGEEPGLLGSTEWVETHAEELTAKAVAYINTDSNGRGYLGVGGSHGLESLVNEVAGDVEDPEKKIPVGKRARLRQIEDSKTADERREARERRNMRISALGSGSDFTPFLQHLGIASLNLGYGGEGGGGVYHSIYDDFSWYSRFSDGEFVYGRALAQTTGLLTLRLANADLLPFDFTSLADTVGTYVKELRTLAADRREANEEKTRRIDEGVFAALEDPREPLAAETREPAVPYFDFSPLENASENLRRAAREFERASESKTAYEPARLAAVNALIRSVERGMLRPEGLPRRPWFKHFLYAPGFYTGYDVKTLPAVREAIEEKQWSDVNREIARTAATIDVCAGRIREAAKRLTP
ncbi:MAG: M28 family metallopeptidase [Acidobacteria bacterium]|nr:M28 family metallopeptidase [Acidobacteriota bacterium]MCA1611547.1 M28 family metallopeptidase [Acidobacteriota bacterium]